MIKYIVLAIILVSGYLLLFDNGQLDNEAISELKEEGGELAGNVANNVRGQIEGEISSKDNASEEVILVSSVKEFNIKAFKWGYDPDVITIKKGDKVKLIINNTDFEHGLRIPDLGVSGKDIIEFTADEVGEFDWFCTSFCGSGHSDMGGKFIVEE